MPWDYPNCGNIGGMNERNTSVSLLVAGAAAGLTLTYLGRTARARMRRPIMQAMTVVAPRDRVQEFLDAGDRFAEALGNRAKLKLVERLELRDAPDDRGTEMYLTMRGAGKYAVKDVLRRVKALIEAGEMPTGRRYA